MKDCKIHTKDLVAFLYGELDAYRQTQLKKHLQTCEQCRDELSGFERIVQEADSLHPDIAKAMDSVD